MLLKKDIQRLLFLGLILISSIAAAREKPKKENYFPGDYLQAKYMAEVSFQYGKLLAFYPNQKFEITQNSWILESAFYFPTKGKHAWQRKKRYPLLGISFSAANFGSGIGTDKLKSEVKFGEAYSIIPHFTVFFLRNELIDIYARLGLGLAYITQQYDTLENPYNDMIGSAVNHIAQLKLGMYWKVHKNISINTGFAFTHYSNSGVRRPNLGFNHVSGLIGIRYNFSPAKYDYNKEPIPKPVKKNFYSIKFTTGFLQFKSYYPKALTYMGTFQYSRATNITNKIIAGVTVGYDEARYLWGIRKQVKEDIRRHDATELSFYVGDEFYIGNVGLFAVLGVYTVQQYNKISPLYWKLGGNYYFPKMGNSNSQMFFGINTKSHGFFAEALELSIGARF